MPYTKYKRSASVAEVLYRLSPSLKLKSYTDISLLLCFPLIAYLSQQAKNINVSLKCQGKNRL